jgi:hypothetical protein
VRACRRGVRGSARAHIEKRDSRAARAARIDAAEAWQAHSAAAAAKDAWKPTSFAVANSGYRGPLGGGIASAPSGRAVPPSSVSNPAFVGGAAPMAAGGAGSSSSAGRAAIELAPVGAAAAAADPLWDQLRGYRATPAAAPLADAIADAARDHSDVSVGFLPPVVVTPEAAVPAFGEAISAPFDPFSLPVAPGASASARAGTCAGTRADAHAAGVQSGRLCSQRRSRAVRCRRLAHRGAW